ncbi:cmp-n-acetylneuraminate-beta-galactosamide-alpha- -sialyltransferase 1-like protein [Chrysochromulina tobinii]|uniref:beta-galactoside alpha-(2,6)-sialyltransferase n=1 Tax=Chrysochromulina tobinii TaxID=1460289 RepID=A0A0M0JDH8_9EUKA|nr:cmp-n-acetylneuraminate-beta-galactosamide-alpha- -sialyltransferase 1-like protein [Chrysochromulina tobinii]|eukprot:KOO24515.1 cmp-n-acetylneuraminate-beta-galactosamide-alpha- -sialyltransferase 1-like protein [Chrysochromulina sp. CCMP291]
MQSRNLLERFDWDVSTAAREAAKRESEAAAAEAALRSVLGFGDNVLEDVLHERLAELKSAICAHEDVAAGSSLLQEARALHGKLVAQEIELEKRREAERKAHLEREEKKREEAQRKAREAEEELMNLSFGASARREAAAVARALAEEKKKYANEMRARREAAVAAAASSSAIVHDEEHSKIAALVATKVKQLEEQIELAEAKGNLARAEQLAEMLFELEARASAVAQKVEQDAVEERRALQAEQEAKEKALWEAEYKAQREADAADEELRRIEQELELIAHASWRAEHHEDRGGRSIDLERVGAQRHGNSQKLLVDNINAIDSWLSNASFAADPALRWPGPVRELNRAHVEATSDPIMSWMVPHVRRDGPLVRAVPHGGKHGGALGTRYQPQRRCESASVIDELTAPIFIAAERPRKLTSEGAPFGMRMGGKSEDDMVSSIRRYVANSSQPRQCRYRTCAVVGSSGALRGTHHGASIDAHTAVIRINAAPTHKHEAAVGRRTTWRVHNSEKPFMLAANDVPELQLVICHMAWLGSCQHQAFSGAYGTTIAYINPRFYSQLFELLGRPRDKQSPSTGLLAIAIALGTCRHYWECTAWEDESKYYDPLHTFHDWQAEERLRQLWLEAGLVSLGTEAVATEAAGGGIDDVGARNASEAVRRRVLGRTVTGGNATAAESKPRISKGKIKKVMRHWTSAGPAEAGG